MNEDPLPVVHTKEFITPIGKMFGAATEERLILLTFAETLSPWRNTKEAAPLAGGSFVPSKGENTKNEVLETLWPSPNLFLKLTFRAGNKEQQEVSTRFPG